MELKLEHLVDAHRDVARNQSMPTRNFISEIADRHAAYFTRLIKTQLIYGDAMSPTDAFMPDKEKPLHDWSREFERLAEDRKDAHEQLRQAHLRGYDLDAPMYEARIRAIENEMREVQRRWARESYPALYGNPPPSFIDPPWAVKSEKTQLEPGVKYAQDQLPGTPALVLEAKLKAEKDAHEKTKGELKRVHGLCERAQEASRRAKADLAVAYDEHRAKNDKLCQSANHMERDLGVLRSYLGEALFQQILTESDVVKKHRETLLEVIAQRT